MKSILSYFTLVCLPFWASAQQSLLVITDTFQERNNFVSSAERELLQDARMTVERCTHDQVYAHFCSGDGTHYTQGKQNALLHLDSIPGITMYSPSSWKTEKKQLIPGLIQRDFALSGALRIEVFCNSPEIKRLKTELLDPLANTLGLVNPDGSMIANRLSIRVHHGYKEPDGKSITTIQSR